MSFEDLPSVLKSVISGFAWDCNWEMVEKDMNMCKEIECMDISAVFVRDVMWSQKYKTYLPSPLKEFEPICNYTGSWADFFDWHAVQEMLWRLDFRRKFVRIINSREKWRRILSHDWRNIVCLDEFYRFLLYTRVPCFKPLWKPLGFSCMQSYRSPFLSARWWLE